jgi:hypothetical protein
LWQKKQKIIFQLDSGAHFSVLPFSLGPQSNDKNYHSRHIWQAPRALVYLASALLLGRPSVLSPLVPETPATLLEWDVLSQLKLKFSSPQAAISAAHFFKKK